LDKKRGKAYHDFMLTILKEYSSPSSKVSGKGGQNGVVVEFILAAPYFGRSSLVMK
jgi:hypothetical protein